MAAPTETTDIPRGQVRCVVVTPEKATVDTTAEIVVLPMFDGELAVQPGRAPLVGRLGAGELRLRGGAAGLKRFYVDAGFVQVQANTVTVLTAKAVEAAKVTAEE